MIKEREFAVMRYSLIEEAQAVFGASLLPDQKGEAIVPALKDGRGFELSGVEYRFLGFDAVDERLLVGKIAKRRVAQIGVLADRDVVEVGQEDWVASILVVDTKDQYVLVSRNWKFGDDGQHLRALEAGINRFALPAFNHKCFVRPVVERGVFWRIISDKRRLYRLRLRLVSPNILETDKAARAAVESLQNAFNQDEASIDLKNDAGLLRIPDWLRGYVDYIENGEGEWRLVTEGDSLFGKKSFRSSDSVETVMLDTSEDESGAGDLPGMETVHSERLVLRNLREVLSSIKQRRRAGE
jgi:hypothetical protein